VKTSTTLVYPDGREVHYDYSSSNDIDDDASRIRGLKDGGSFLLRYDYLGLGTPVEVTYPFHDINFPGGGYTRLMQHTLIGTSSSNDADTGDQYKGLDRFGRVKDSRWVRYHNGTPGDLDRIKHGYDRASNRIWRENPVAAGQSKEFDEFYAHDGLHRVKEMGRGAIDSGHSTLDSTTFGQCWTLDATGNWKGFRQDDDGNGSWDLAQQRSANAVNEITGVTEAAGASWATPGYDAAGNMTTVPQPADPTTSYTATYDAWNRLVKLEEEVSGSNSSSSGGGGGPQTVQENQYDARRYRTVRKDYSGGVLSETRHFYYTEQWQSIEERVGTSSTPERQHVWGLRYIDDLVRRERDTDGDGDLDESLYALQDANWNVTALVGSIYEVQERYAYTAYGEPAVLDEAFGARTASDYAWDVLYAGYRWDQGTGLQYVRHRMHCSLLGKWLQRDPLQRRNASCSGSFNPSSLYAYCHGTPLSAIDPTGLKSVHHWFSQFKGKGQSMLNAVCNVTGLAIDSFTTDLGSLRKGDPHHYITNVYKYNGRKYNDAVKHIYDSSSNCCELLTQMLELILDAWKNLQSQGTTGMGGPIAPLTMQKYNCSTCAPKNTLDDLHKIVDDVCNLPRPKKPRTWDWKPELQPEPVPVVEPQPVPILAPLEVPAIERLPEMEPPPSEVIGIGLGAGIAAVGAKMVAAGAASSAVLLADDATVIGVVDDPLLIVTGGIAIVGGVLIAVDSTYKWLNK
jgi:RHS repeat-associated protein